MATKRSKAKPASAKGKRTKAVKLSATGKKSAKTSKAESKLAASLSTNQMVGQSLADVLRAPQGHVNVDGLDANATPGYPGKGKQDAGALTEELRDRIADLQERLYANGRDGDGPSVLVVLQGMDTSGKGGVIRHVFGMVDPQGVHLKAFKAPSEEERQHDFLWRIRREVPAPGMIGIFDRSHYEDVLIARVNNLVPEEEWQQRYALINEFEQQLRAEGTVIVKCFLHAGFDEQKQRLAERLADPSKYWKYNPGDLDSRSHWSAYMDAYADLLARCNPDSAPWFVIPSNKKWYRNWAIAQLLLDHLASLDLTWPPATFDVAAEKARVAAS